MAKYRQATDADMKAGVTLVAFDVRDNITAKYTLATVQPFEGKDRFDPKATRYHYVVTNNGESMTIRPSHFYVRA